MPIIPPLGFDGDGKTYRVNSDGLAVAVAAQLKAVKLIFVTAQPGLLHRGQLIRQMMVERAQSAACSRTSAGFAPEMVSKAQHAVRGCQAGIPRVHVIDGTLDEGLLGEVFSNHGLGTLIYANEYENIRPAQKKDVRAIYALTQQGVEADELLKRTEKHDREATRRLLHLRDRQEPGRLRRAARLSRAPSRASWRVST